MKIFGDVASVDLGGPHAPEHYLTAGDESKRRGSVRGREPIKQAKRDDHWLNWLKCLRSRAECHASIEAGYQHAVARVMAMQSYDMGHRMVYDHGKRAILPG